MKKYHKSTGKNLFCNDFVLLEASKHTHPFLKELKKEIDFSQWYKKLINCYKGKGNIGAPSYNPVLLFKMLFLSYLFNVTEREIERLINDSISMKIFLELSLDEAAPDHSSLSYFKKRILYHDELYGEDTMNDIFTEIILNAQARGVDLGYTQIIDSTHTVADVNTKKENKRTKAKKDGGKGKKKRDPCAKWGVKKIKKVLTTDNKKVKVKESYYGYKSHLSVSGESNLITSYKTTAMNYPDNYGFLPLFLNDIINAIAIEEKTTYAADRGYDDGELHVWLNKYRMKDSICLKHVKEYEKIDDKVQARWTQYTNQQEFEAGLKKRYIVERVNGDLKKHHGLGRARYLGLPKMQLQTALTAIAHNLKTLVKNWTGVGLRTFSTPNISHVS